MQSRINHITVLGGSGFVGTRLCSLLQQRGFRVRVLTRNASNCRALAVLPNVEIVTSSTLDKSVLGDLLSGTDAVINLVGILNERGHSGKGFFSAHTELAQALLRTCQELNIGRILHMSALNANPDGPSYYLRSKGQAENYLLTFAGKKTRVTLFRPSVIFGPNDSFLNRFARLLRITPIMPLACPNARFSPVFVGDVVQAMADSILDSRSYGQKIDLCGPRVYTLREIVEYTAKVCGLKRLVIGLPNSLSYLQAQVLEFVPGKPFSLDNFHSLSIDSVCEKPPLGTTTLESVAPGYLSR